ncbi:protein FAM3C isoform X1 [Xyrauchen texanus]|uniref:protein FAM3C isoform X1 n=2 Tax=Xyrauchen texanus TaxID=154827 RepID=UPI002242A3A5|nr:protein FAM3C isoform X1 [Xyrauchen texanus]
MIYIRRDKLKFIFMVCVLILSASIIYRLLQTSPESTLTHFVDSSGRVNTVKLKSDHHKNDGPRGGKCGLPAPCPRRDFAFKISSGATSIIGPQICFDGKMLIKKEIRGNHQGINVVVINEKTGEHIKTGSFNMWNGDVRVLIAFLKSIEDGSLVLMATMDDPATKLNEEARTLITELGSSYISKVKFRDNWVFVGGKNTITQVSFEQHLKNDRKTNKYESWPEMIEIEGCIPQLE